MSRLSWCLEQTQKELSEDRDFGGEIARQLQAHSRRPRLRQKNLSGKKPGDVAKGVSDDSHKEEKSRTLDEKPPNRNDC